MKGWADEQKPDKRRDVSLDELARDNEVPYSSREGFVNQAAMHGRYCDLPREVSHVPFRWLSVEQSTLIACVKSAEGILAVETSCKGCHRRCGGLTRRRPERYVRGSKRHF